MKVNAMIVSVLVAGMAWSMGVSKAMAEEIQYHDSDSGTFSPSTIDYNEDGSPGAIGIGAGKSTQGNTSHHFFSENDTALIWPNVKCPEGTFEFAVVRARSVRRFPTGDLLVDEINPGKGIGSGFSCITVHPDLSITFTSTVTGEWTGGTGRFANATGPVTVYSSGTVLVTDPTTGVVFGSYESSAEGTVILP